MIKPGLYFNEHAGQLFECHGAGAFGEKANMVVNFRRPFFPIDEYNIVLKVQEADCLYVNEFEAFEAAGIIVYIGEV